MQRHLVGLTLASSLALLAAGALFHAGDTGAADEPGPPSKQSTNQDPKDQVPGAAVWTTPLEPKRLSDRVNKGLDWLVKHQLESGGWGQGEESPNMRGAGNPTLMDRANVADSCIAAIALIRAGNTPRQGPYQAAVARAARFVVGQVEESDSQSISVTTVQGTRVQQKLGPNIDTFLASMLLAELKGRMAEETENRRVDLALDKVLAKIKAHQKADGSFDGQGWAPILAQSLGGKGINRARQAGAQVSGQMLARAEEGAKRSFAMSTPSASPAESGILAGASATAAGPRTSSPVTAARPLAGRMSPGDAGVELYSRAASIGVLQDSVNTFDVFDRQLRDDAKNHNKPEVREEARRTLARHADARKVQNEAQKAVIDRLGDKSFISGFGSNGGEEFLSYMNIAESLVVKGGPEWRKWDDEMTGNLNRVQNDDGSWSGHHCITGRTFCTSAALLVLMADRTPVPVVAKSDPKANDR